MKITTERSTVGNPYQMGKIAPLRYIAGITEPPRDVANVREHRGGGGGAVVATSSKLRVTCPSCLYKG